MVKRGWHNPPKYVELTTKGRCSLCHKFVKSLEHHFRSKHKGKKIPKKLKIKLSKK